MLFTNDDFPIKPDPRLQKPFKPLAELLREEAEMKIANSTSTHLVNQGPCPVCGDTPNAVTETTNTGVLPVAGDISICTACFSMLVFNADMTRRVATIKERAEAIKDNPGLLDVLPPVPHAPPMGDSF